MSQENIERLAQFYEAFNVGDLEPLLALADPHFVYRTRDEFPGGGSFDMEAALDRISALHEVLDELRWEPQEFIDAGDRTVVVVRQTARGRISGAPIAGSITHVWLTQDGKAKELCVYSNRSDALDAVGLSE